MRAEEVIFRFPDGRAVTTLANATPIYSEDGEIVAVVAVLQDMTPLAEMERLRSEFLGMVSHELRTPLTTIKGSSATVLGSSTPFDDSEVRQVFRIIDDQADRLRDLVNNLLDMTRVEAGMLSVNPEPTAVTALIDEAKNRVLARRRKASRRGRCRDGSAPNQGGRPPCGAGVEQPVVQRIEVLARFLHDQGERIARGPSRGDLRHRRG